MEDKIRRKIWIRLKKGVVQYDEEIVVNAAKDVIDNHVDIYEAVMNGLVPGILEVGELYDRGEYFVPEMLMCSDALYAGLNVLRPYLKQDKPRVNGQIVIGVVQGDVHDIGKNIVKMMFDAAGFQVHDLGRDVPLEKFVHEQLRTDCEFVCLSAMMTTTMYSMHDIIMKIKEKNPKVRIMVGGAPLNADLANKWGADGYAKDAPNAIRFALKMVNSLKDLTT